MACTCSSYNLAGLCRDCDGSLGGIKEVYIALHKDVASVTLNSAGTEISAITMNSGTTFYKYQLRKNTSSLTKTLNVADNGNTYVTSELNLVLGKMETKKRIEMCALSKEETAVIVLDANGKYWYLGFDEGVTASAGTGETGTNRTDNNQYTITLQDMSKEYPFEVPASVVEGLDKVEPSN